LFGFSPRSNDFVITGKDGRGPLRILDIRSGRERFVVGNQSEYAQRFLFSSDGRFFAVGTRQGRVRLCRAESGEGPAGQAIALIDNVLDFGFTAKGKMLIAQDSSKSSLLRIGTNEVWTIGGRVSYSPDGTRAVGISPGSRTGQITVSLWKVCEEKRPEIITEHQFTADFGAIVSPDLKTIVCVS
jgi:hypothetical protein